MKGDEGNVPHVSATSRRKKCPIRVNGLHEKKKKNIVSRIRKILSFVTHESKLVLEWLHGHIDRGSHIDHFINQWIGAHERSSDHKLCHNCHRKTN